jgi:ribosome biogenesis GTPase / thiamine phosphate phosphatase
VSQPLPGALAAYGWTERVLTLYNDLDDPSSEPARVVRVERSAVAAVFATGEEQLLHATALPAVGDWIAAGPGTVRHVLPRWSSLTRVDPAGAGLQVLAANLDLVMVTAPADRLNPARIERELVLAWESGATPLVVLTKRDLMVDDARASLSERLVGVDVIATSATTGQGLGQLFQRLRPSRTAVLLGPSGAGKSSLANALLGANVLATGAVREGDHRGRHTTTSRQLVPVPGGGVLIDTPGLRSLGLAASVAVEAAFPEIETLAEECRFSDCRHEDEPGCAVVDATSAGDLDVGRLASYRKLQREVAAEAQRADPLLRKAELSLWKARVKSAKLNDKRRGR